MRRYSFYIIILLCNLVNCSPSINSHQNNEQQKIIQNSNETTEQLLKKADSLIFEGNDTDKLNTAYTLIEEAEKRGIKTSDTYLKKAKICYYIAVPNKNKKLLIDNATKGKEYASELIKMNPDKVEGYYYYAILLGLLVEAQPLGGIQIVPEIQKAAQKSVDIDPQYDDGGPLRTLGMLYVKAPPWPTSIGDIDLGIELLRKAVKMSTYPLNRLLLAEALVENGQNTEGKSLIKEVLAEPPRGRWKYSGKIWRRYAKEILLRIKANGS